MSTSDEPGAAHVGDWIEAHRLHGEPARRGRIEEVIGSEGHLRYRVRWDDRHESIVFPAEGVVVIPPPESGDQPPAA